MARWIFNVGLLLVVLAILWHVGGWHIVHKPTDAQLYCPPDPTECGD